MVQIPSTKPGEFFKGRGGVGGGGGGGGGDMQIY